jgi:hypothetical protein
MNEYQEDVNKGGLICVKRLHNSCGCHKCKEARVKSGTPVKVTQKEPEPATVSQTAKG